MPYTVVFFSQLQVLIAALSCIACRCNSLALIGCERAAISCTRMQLQPAVAHHNRNPCKRSRQIVADKGSANLNRSQAGCRKSSIDGQGSYRSVDPYLPLSPLPLSPSPLTVSISVCVFWSIVKLPGASKKTDKAFF